MKIKKLLIHNFRGISDMTVEPGSGLNLYIGKNGSGKTAIIDAAAIALSWFTVRHSNRNANGRIIRKEDIRNGQKEAYISLQAELGTEPVAWTLYGYAEGPGERLKSEFTQLNRYIDDVGEHFEKGMTNLPLICYYPTTRAFVDVPKRIRIPHDFSIQTSAYNDSLETGANFRVFFEWFKNQEDLENEVAVHPSEDINAYLLPRLKDVKRAIEEFTGFSDLRIKRFPQTRMTLRKGTDEIEVSQLSDGEKIYLSLVADLARRAVIAHPIGDPLKETTGVVLIDEVELHLHPRWQREILPRLASLFPKIQFLVTTHSPQVVGEAMRNRSWLVDRERGLEPIGIAYGANSDQILENIMDAESRDPEVKGRIQKIYELLSAGSIEVARKKLEELKAEIGEDPETVRIAAVIRRIEVLGK